MAINELRISGVLGVCAPRPLFSIPSSAVAGIFELNMLLLFLFYFFYVLISN